MKCPVDKSLMIVVEHLRVELDYCRKCSSVWLDSGELELLIAVLVSEGAKVPEIELDKTAHQGKRKCPICGQQMDKVRMGHENRVLVDRCPFGHGLWFDAGELQKVLHEAAPSETQASQDVVHFLGEAFYAVHKQGSVK